MIKDFYKLTKPGIVYGNIFSMLAGLAFASKGVLHLEVTVAATIGLALVIASSCVFNNCLDRNIDRKMARTKDRALVTGALSLRSALIFASVLGALGFWLLFQYVNILSGVAAIFGFVAYLFVYGYAKRASHWGTVVGSISGAVPILVGYTAIVDKIDFSAGLLFLAMVIWQMPHFYAIAIYRGEEYGEAGIPVLPLVKGVRKAKQHILGYILAYLIIVSLPTFFGYAGVMYLFTMLLVSTRWLMLALSGFNGTDDIIWARSVFKFSLIVLIVFSVAIAVAPIVP